MKLEELPPKLPQSAKQQAPNSERILRTSLELEDRAIDIEWATRLKFKPNATNNQALGMLLAEWSATFGPWASLRILRVALHAIFHPIWRSSCKRRGTRTDSGYLRRPR